MLPSDLHGLSPVQAQAALSLASGASLLQAAQSAGIARSTLYRWLNENSAFARAVDAAREEYVDSLRDLLREASQKALNALISVLDDPAAPAGVRLRAALAVLKRPHFPDPGWNLPEPVESPEHQAILDTLATLKAQNKVLNYQNQFAFNRTKSDTFEQEIPTPPPQTQPPPPAQQAAPPPTQQPYVNPNKTGRNEPCPCGSGRKYKHCCLNKPHQAAAA